MFLVEKYHAERHPDVRHHNKRPEELREEFAVALEIYMNISVVSSIYIRSEPTI